MKLLARLAPVVAALLIAGCAQTPAKPDEGAYAPANGGFSVQMPGPVREHEKNNTHMYASGAGRIAYVIGYTELPPSVASVKAERLLDVARNKLVRSGKVSVIKEKKATVDGHPARDMYLKTAKKGYFMRLRMVVSGSRFYRVSAITNMDNSNSPEITKFIESFHFTKQ